jgi:hypothetical protein
MLTGIQLEVPRTPLESSDRVSCGIFGLREACVGRALAAFLTVR